ncbi:plasmid stabilization protein [Luteibacter rhizovicinus DSM 16549]|uniref:Plasmid stabilization protein n=1 Tax=Luteibacter rhizovicinus DSM 16549 TaxID=1440763 RepID=A0A0G9HM50_9GAMM|nr:type II toxin-antitoxin system RelE/ParE family toxin [Luteibacter rhizovicinus]APG03580.1 plasmid stabilization protein [Luteibacter rhizovicinus DSM 16549]KLD68747.1 plasmid stabilization protein [Luteibacter rhizovicinus DSM 16549]KLD77042.1 plasmid stabilization protein [Xanthomonas hyacinthi DSM 19077]
MSYEVRYTDTALEDLHRLMDFIEGVDSTLADRALDAIVRASALLESFPFTCRKASPDNPFLRELVVSFGATGYVALFDIAGSWVTIVALRHQREDDFLY